MNHINMIYNLFLCQISEFWGKKSLKNLKKKSELWDCGNYVWILWWKQPSIGTFPTWKRQAFILILGFQIYLSAIPASHFRKFMRKSASFHNQQALNWPKSLGCMRRHFPLQSLGVFCESSAIVHNSVLFGWEPAKMKTQCFIAVTFVFRATQSRPTNITS